MNNLSADSINLPLKLLDFVGDIFNDALEKDVELQEEFGDAIIVFNMALDELKRLYSLDQLKRIHDNNQLGASL
jgi:predicted nucleic acid-binding protein